MAIHLFSFFCIFYYLDERFLKIGLEYFTNEEKLDQIFHDSADCMAGKHGKWSESWETVRKTCELYMNPFYKKALVGLWILYVAGAICHVLYLSIQVLALITCLEKR